MLGGVGMIRVYLLEVGGLRQQIEKGAQALPGWDKLTDWQREKISRCAAPGAKALCMGGQLLLQYGAWDWSDCASWRWREECGKQAALGDWGKNGESTTEDGISWQILDLSRLLEQIPAPQSLTVVYGSKGKPGILHVPWHYNLSHSGDYAALAVSDAPVGIDIQQMRPCKGSLVKRFFSPEEAELYESLVSGETLFYTLWCRKEAYGKLLGTGLTEEMLKCNMLEDIGVHLYEYGGLPSYGVCVCAQDRSCVANYGL